MKKSLSLILMLTLVFGLFANMAAAADATAPTTTEKLQWFVDKGILKGTPDGKPHLEDKLTRAEFATIAVAVAGLTPATSGSSFSDVKVGQWYFGAIEAAKAAGLVDGIGGGKFGPKTNVTVESIIKVATAIAKVKPVDGAVVAGSSDWAGPFIKAALDAGLIADGLNYKGDATRGNTIDIAYSVAQSLAVKANEVVSATATGVKKVTVKFNQAVDTSKVTVVLKKDNIVSNVAKATWNDAKTEVTLETSIALANGDYTATASGIDFAANKNVVTFTVAPERIDSVWIDGAAYRTVIGGPNVTLAFKLLNQYGEDITTSSTDAQVSVTPSLGVPAVSTANKEVTITGVGSTTTSLTVTIVDLKNAKSASKTVPVEQFKSISEITISAPEVKTGKTVLEANDTGIVFPTVVKDQFGNVVKLTNADVVGAAQKITFISSDAALNVATAAIVNDKLTFDLGAFNGPKTITLTAIVNATGKTAAVTFTANGAKQLAEPTIVAPTSKFGANDHAYKVEVQVKDQYGNAMSADDIKALHTGLTVVSGNSSVFTVVNAATPITVDGGKAYVTLSAVGNGTANLTVTVNSTGKSSTQAVTVVDAKYPVAVTLKPDYTKAVKGASIVLKATFVDQYGEEFKTDGANILSVITDNNNFGNTYATATPVSVGAFDADHGLTLTAADHDKATKVTVKLFKEAAQTTLLDTRELTISSVKSDAALTYQVEAIGTIADVANGNTTTSAYAKTVKVSALDSSNVKVALPGTAIQAISAADPSKLAVTTTAPWKVAAKKLTADAETTLNVTISKQDGTPTVIQAPVKVSIAAPVATSIVFKKGSDALGTSIKVASGTTIDFADKDDVNAYVEVKDQYDTTALSSVAAIYVTNPAGVLAINPDGEVTFTGTSGQKYKVTAVIADKTVTLTVEIQ